MISVAHIAAFLAGVSLLAAQPAPTSDAATTTTPAIPNSSEVIRRAYRALVQDSIVPADSRTVATAALDALEMFAPDHVPSLPPAFGEDPAQDAAWLGHCVGNLPSPWPVVEAMARSAATVHVGLATPERRKGFGALTTGEPLAPPGFNIYSLPGGQFVVFDVISGASAHTAGLHVGDVLRRVDGRATARVDPFLLNAYPVGAHIPLEIERDGNPVTISLRLLKTAVSPVQSGLLDDRVAYIFVRWFARSANPDHDTAALVRRALIQLSAAGADALILDLRSALGGFGRDQHRVRPL